MATKPSIALIPSGYKAGTLYSVLPSNGDADFTTTRNTSATRVNKDGLIELVASGVPRLNYPLVDGVVSGCPSYLSEPQSLNSQINSEDLSSYSVGDTTISPNLLISPDGTQNADKLVETNTNARHELYGKLLNFSGTSSVSFFAKADERRYISVFIGGDPTFGGATFDVEDGIITNESGGTNADIKSYGNGWYRCSLTSTKVATSSVYYCLRKNGNEVSIQTYQGDGTSGMYLWGFQTEINKPYPTSYIPTTTSAVSRSADTASADGLQDSINSAEGTMFVDFKPQELDGGSRYLSIENSSTVSSGWMGIFASLVGSDIKFRFYGDGWDFDDTIIIERNESYKIAVSYRNGVQTSAYINGILIGNLTASLSGKSFQKIRLSEGAIGTRGDASFKDLRVYKTALQDSEIEYITSYRSFNEMATNQQYTIL